MACRGWCRLAGSEWSRLARGGLSLCRPVADRIGWLDPGGVSLHGQAGPPAALSRMVQARRIGGGEMATGGHYHVAPGRMARASPIWVERDGVWRLVAPWTCGGRCRLAGSEWGELSRGGLSPFRNVGLWRMMWAAGSDWSELAWGGLRPCARVADGLWARWIRGERAGLMVPGALSRMGLPRPVRPVLRSLPRFGMPAGCCGFGSRSGLCPPLAPIPSFRFLAYPSGSPSELNEKSPVRTQVRN
jgi:hypothetical protein